MTWRHASSSGSPGLRLSKNIDVFCFAALKVSSEVTTPSTVGLSTTQQ